MLEIFNKKSISMKDVNTLNQDIVDYLMEQGENCFIEKNKTIIKNISSVEDISKQIKDDGIVVIPNVLDSTYCEKIENFLIKTIDNYKNKLNNNSFFEDELALIQYTRTKVSGYSNLKNYNKPIINIRRGLDKNMIDIFNVNDLNNDLFYNIKHFLKSDVFSKIFSRLDAKGIVNNINAYINKDVIQTRGFHADSYDSNQYKVFFYLTDVLSFSKGPYTYVRGTHKASSYRNINKLIGAKLNNLTEAPVVPYSKIHPILGNKGTLIISNQEGFHRGFPQKIGNYRVILSINIG